MRPIDRSGRPPDHGGERAVRHVLMTADAVGGVWTYAVELARGLGDRGVRVSLAVLGPAPSEAQRDEVAAIPSVQLFERPFALEWMDDPWGDVDESGTWLLALERALHPDVVHVNGYCHAALAWSAPVLAVGHSCVLSWWRSVHGTDAPAAWETYARRVAAGLSAAQLVVAPTAAMMSMLELHYGPIRERRVIANGRAARRAADAAAPSKEPFVLTTGRLWDQAKNVETVCAAAPRVPWPIYVAGDVRRPDGDAVSPAGVRCLGRLDANELAAWMDRAAIYALPARYEPFGLSILEAALARCALVLGDIRSLREIWGDAAVYVPPDNRGALAGAIEMLARDPARREDLAARAEARARALTPARMADGYLDAYAHLVSTSVALTA